MNHSTAIKASLWVVWSTLGISAWAADTPKLAAPIYKGAVIANPTDGIRNLPANPGLFGGVKALDCSGLELSKQNTRNHGPWCFLTRDPIDKVKAFYEKSVGPLATYTGTWSGKGTLQVTGYGAVTERAWFASEESGARFYYNGVSLHALPPPRDKAKSVNPKAAVTDDDGPYNFYANTRHFGPLVQGLNWMGDAAKRDPKELDDLYRKYSRLEAALFQMKGNPARAVDDILRDRTIDKQQELTHQANATMQPDPAQLAQIQQMQQQMMQNGGAITPEMMAQMQQMSAQGQPPMQQGGGARNDAEFNAYMKRNPAVAKKYVALTQKVATLMQQGKFDEADKADEELQQLIAKNPELAAIEQGGAPMSAPAPAPQADPMAGFNAKMDQANWTIWENHIKEIDKQAYYTLIVIDTAYQGTEKDYSRDRKQFPAEVAAFPHHQQVFGFTYKPQEQGAKAQAPAAQDDLKETAKKGLKALKKLF